jgi:predicted RNA polymerase sigma factor
MERVEFSAWVAPDDRLRLIFTCCHPALNGEAQIALTLREVCGLTTQAVARAFLVSEDTMAQRLVRAKRKILHISGCTLCFGLVFFWPQRT